MSGIRPGGPVGQFFAAAERGMAARAGTNQTPAMLDKVTKATGNVLKAAVKEGGAAVKQGPASYAATKAFDAVRNADRFIDSVLTNGARRSSPANIVGTPTPAATFTADKDRYGQKGPSSNVTGLIKGAAELAQFVWAGYNHGKLGPVSIAPATLTQGGKSIPVHLVGISGTDIVQGQSTSLANNPSVAFGKNNPMFANAKAAILATVPKGSNLVLAGHSQGGMVAQQLAADKDIQAHYNVMQTVTFGSPEVMTGKPEGTIKRIAANPDPVPLLNSRSLGAGLEKWSPADAVVAKVADAVVRRNSNQQLIDSDFGSKWMGFKSHIDDYTNESNGQLSQMDALGRRVGVGETGATLQVNLGQRKFFSSPVNSTGRVITP
ncbi:hypothetical protein [Corallococcus aberystwythensis]|uniref:hypothetical protein n=1 Tax=Corallococcus aberystwythensis TaxID=2316722 RepID=UPI0011C44456|nr:hypothetical protein [Corallococcus aberystwythensis]